MKKYCILSIFAANLLVTPAQATGYDILGGSEGAQTIHHCGYLSAGGRNYTGDLLVTRILQKKLAKLGYYRLAIDGRYGKGSKAAMRDFQKDHGMPATGLADGESVSRLAYATHPSANVGRCDRMASNGFR
jgi:hypothetical protein